jgi:hypothetical protein
MYKKYQFGGVLSQLSSNPFGGSNPLDDLSKFKPLNTSSKKSSKFGSALKGVGSFIGNNTSLISSGLDAFSTARNAGKSSVAQTDPTSLAVKNSIKGALNFVPGGQILNLADSLFGAIGGGLGSATTGDKILSAIPVLGSGISMFAGKTKDFKGDISDISTGEFGGVVQDSLDAKDISGVKSIAKGKLNKQITQAQNQFDKTRGIINYNKKRFDNDIGSSFQSALLNQYSGNQQLTKVGKKGMKFPELENARLILNSLNKPQKFQLGGKMNLLPDGELHARKHDIEKYDKDLEGKITKKGIPVVTSDGTQTAEIEKEEWVLRKEFTDKIESLYKQYKDTNSDEIAIEAGKLVCFELLKNTDDRSKLIKNIK